MNVAQVLTSPRFLVPKLTVWRIIQKYKVHGTISDLSGTGRPFKLTRKQLQHLAQTGKRTPKPSECEDWADIPPLLSPICRTGP